MGHTSLPGGGCLAWAGSVAYAWDEGSWGMTGLVPSRVIRLGVTPAPTWAIAEDQVKVTASAGHVEVAISLSTWPLARDLAGTGAVALPVGVGSPHRTSTWREAASAAPLNEFCSVAVESHAAEPADAAEAGADDRPHPPRR